MARPRPEPMQVVKKRRDAALKALVDGVPYIRFLGIEFDRRGDELTAIMPFDFLRLIWATLLAAWLFAEAPDLFTWIGAAVIFGAGLYIANRERQAKKRVTTDD